MSECKSDIEVIGDVCEVSTEQYCTTFRTRDIGISAGNQIALLHSMLIDRDQRLAAAEAAIKAQEEEAARTHDAWGEEVNDYATRLAAAEATIERLSRGILNAAGWRECEGDPLGKSNEDLAS